MAASSSWGSNALLVRVTVSSFILRTTVRRATPDLLRWCITVVLCTLYRRESVSIEEPCRSMSISCSTSVRDRRCCTGFESRPIRSTRRCGVDNGRGWFMLQDLE